MVSRAAKLVGLVLMVLVPLFGFWLASSLAAYNNATQWLSLLVGLALFPLLPAAWELFYSWRRKRAKVPSSQILTRLDRLVVRTLIINVLFLGGMMWKARAVSFRAIAVRGDWMLDGFEGGAVDAIRGVLLGLADRLDKRQTTAHDTYGHSDKAPDDVKPPPPPPVPPPTPDVPAAKPVGEWPLPVEPDPLVAQISADEQHSVEAVGQWFAARISDKKQLVKALHDYVVARLHYDKDALKLIEAKDYEHVPAQTAEAVFDRRSGVCEGYARLMVALGKAAGLEIAYVTGSIRDSERRLAISDDPWDTSIQQALEGVGHAWNAAKLDDRWYLIDVTWDDPSEGEPTSTYLFPPPRLMAFDHYPDDAKWQLLDKPLSLGDFVRQPLMSPRIGELGMSLVSPTRSQITVDGPATIVLDNPYGAAVDARAVHDGADQDAEGEACAVTKGASTTVTCRLAPGEWEIRLYGAPDSATHAGSFRLDYIGSVLVNRQ